MNDSWRGNIHYLLGTLLTFVLFIILLLTYVHFYHEQRLDRSEEVEEESGPIEDYETIEDVEKDKEHDSTGALEDQPAYVVYAARNYRDRQVRYARRYMGLDAPTPLLAAQIHTESHWNADARSPVGARGLAQVMPATAEHIAELDQDLNSDKILADANYSLKAQAIYMNYLFEQIERRDPADRSNHYAFALSAYNGGLGWVDRERRLSEDPSRWYGHVEYQRARSESAFRENRDYIPKIKEKQSIYHSLGWTGPVISYP